MPGSVGSGQVEWREEPTPASAAAARPSVADSEEAKGLTTTTAVGRLNAAYTVADVVAPPPCVRHP